MRWVALSLMLLGLVVVAGCGGGASEDEVRALEERVDELEARLVEVEDVVENQAALLELLDTILAELPIDEELDGGLERAAELVETACGSAADQLGETVGGAIQEACERALDALRDGATETEG